MHSTNKLGSILIANFRIIVSLCSRRRLTVGCNDERVRARGRVSALGGHTNVTIVPTDEIDMSKGMLTDALYLFKYNCHLTPWHALVNICDDNRHMSVEAKDGWTGQARSD